jgi:translation elongation factor EF-4
VDAQQGVQAQTVANFLLSFEENLSVIPVINKVDLPLADVERVTQQMHSVFGFSPEEAIQISAKHGTGIDRLFLTIIDKIPSPVGSRDKPLCLLLFDSWYMPHLCQWHFFNQFVCVCVGMIIIKEWCVW